MNKAELLKTWKEDMEKSGGVTLTLDESHIALVCLCDAIAAELLGGGEISLPGVGKLKVKEVAARKGRKPKTGEAIDIPARNKVVFAACKELKEAMKP